MRDVRDRVARHRTSWREVRFAGLLGGDRTAMVLVSHEGIDRAEVQDVLRRRWPAVLIKKLARLIQEHIRDSLADVVQASEIAQ